MAGRKAKPKKASRKSDFEKLKVASVLCSICRTVFIEPVTLPCDHAFCKQCFEGTMEKANLVCPLCRLRVGSWFRRAKKEAKVVDEGFWTSIQQQYPLEVKNKLRGIANDIEEDKPVIIVANPGEIRKEYEKERQKDLEEQRRMRESEEKASAALIKKINEEEEYKRQVEEEKLRLDELLAKKLAEELSTPSTSKAMPQRPFKYESAKKLGPMDRFVRTDGSMLSSRFSHPKLNLSKTHSINSNKIALSTSPSSSKAYTCHVIPLEQSPIRVNRANNLFTDLDFKGIFGTLGQKPTKTIDPDRRKSICTSGYKSSGSGDNSDVIDLECKFYFKPIDTQRRYHVPGKVPLKVPPMLGVNDGKMPIEPPLGKIFNLGHALSAFARFSGDQQVEQRAPSSNEIEGETLSTKPCLPNRNLKRKTSTEVYSPARKKGRRQVFATKKNLLLKLETKSITSPFRGLDNKPEGVEINSPLFYGFNASQIEESEREKDVVSRYVSICQGSVANKHVSGNEKTSCKSYMTYSRHRNKKLSEVIDIKEPSVVPQKLIMPKDCNNGVNFTKIRQGKLAGLNNSLDRQRTLQYKENGTDINRNIPRTSISPSQRLDNIKISLNANSRSARILSKTLEDDRKPKVNWNTDSANAAYCPKFLNSGSNFLIRNSTTDNSRPEIASNIVGANFIPSTASRKEDSVEINLFSMSPTVEACSKIRNTGTKNGEITGSYISNYLLQNDKDSSVIENYNQNLVALRHAVNKPFINGDLKTLNPSSSIVKYSGSDVNIKREGNTLNENSNSFKSKLSMETPPGIFDSDSEDEVLSKLIDNICNPGTDVENCTNTSPVNMNPHAKHSVNGIPSAKSASDKTRNRPRKATTKLLNKVPHEVSEHLELNSISENVNSSSQVVDKAIDTGKSDRTPRLSKIHHLAKTINVATNSMETNSKITNTFSKTKNSPSKAKGKLKSSPQKTRIINNLRPGIKSLQLNGDLNAEQRKIQEETDFELAKKLQAEFDLIQESSRTRRGTKRQITLDEMLLV